MKKEDLIKKALARIITAERILRNIKSYWEEASMLNSLIKKLEDDLRWEREVDK